MSAYTKAGARDKYDSRSSRHVDLHINWCKKRKEAAMRNRLVIAAVLASMLTVSVFADDMIWENADHEPVAGEIVFEDTETEELAGEDSTYAEQVFDQVEEDSSEESLVEVFAEDVVTDEASADEAFAEEVYTEDETAGGENVFEEVSAEETAIDEASGNEATAVTAEGGLVYTGEPQALIEAGDDEWLYSLDGESFSPEIPTAINAGEYTVYIKSVDGGAVENVTVTIAKADVTYIPPIPNTTE
jgi:hypothetical protein